MTQSPNQNKTQQQKQKQNTSQQNLTSILFPANSSLLANRKNSNNAHQRQQRASLNISSFVNLTQLMIESQKATDTNKDEGILEEYSLCFFHRDHKLRQYLHENIVNHPYFDRLVLFMISLNIIFLSLDDPQQNRNIKSSICCINCRINVYHILCYETCLKS